MSLPVVYQPEAEDDIDSAYAWYEAQLTGPESNSWRNCARSWTAFGSLRNCMASFAETSAPRY